MVATSPQTTYSKQSIHGIPARYVYTHPIARKKIRPIKPKLREHIQADSSIFQAYRPKFHPIFHAVFWRQEPENWHACSTSPYPAVDDLFFYSPHTFRSFFGTFGSSEIQKDPADKKENTFVNGLVGAHRTRVKLQNLSPKTA